MDRKFGLAKKRQKPLADEHHILRHIPRKDLIRDDPDDPEAVTGISPWAFQMRSDEDSLSAAWPEFFDLPDHTARVAAAKADFGTVMKVRPSHRFALGNVGAIRAACKSRGQGVRISHEPADFDSHASIRQINTDDLELLGLLALDAWSELHKP